MKILSILFIASVKLAFGTTEVVTGPEGTNGNYRLPYDTKTETLRIASVSAGSVNDEILVRNPTNQYVRKIALADLRNALNIPVPYTGVTNASGVYAVTFAAPYPAAPNVTAEIIGGNSKMRKKVDVTANGFTVTIDQPNVVSIQVLGIGVNVLADASTPVNNVRINVKVQKQ